MKLRSAEKEELPAILALQKRAFQTEAARFGTQEIPLLQQTLEELTVEYERGILLVAVDEQENLLGSVRGYIEENTLYINKLMTAPEQRRKGVATSLLAALEEMFPDFRKELFTSSRSTENIRMYQSLGYRRIREEENGPIPLIYFEKL